MTGHIIWVEKVANQLGRNGEPLPACQVVEKFLRSLTNYYESKVCTIKESKGLSTLLVEELAESLKTHKQQRKKNFQALD